MKSSRVTSRSQSFAQRVRQENADGWTLTACDFRLGMVYPHLPMDFAKAIKAYDISESEKGPMLECNIGWCYLNGVGCPQDYKRAMEWFTRGTAAGHQSSAGSHYNIAIMYTYSLGVTNYERTAAENYALYFRRRQEERQAYEIAHSGLAALASSQPASAVASPS